MECHPMRCKIERKERKRKAEKERSFLAAFPKDESLRVEPRQNGVEQNEFSNETLTFWLLAF